MGKVKEICTRAEGIMLESDLIVVKSAVMALAQTLLSCESDDGEYEAYSDKVISLLSEHDRDVLEREAVITEEPNAYQIQIQIGYGSKANAEETATNVSQQIRGVVA